MYQEFEKTTIISEFIKELLFSTPIPRIDVINDIKDVYLNTPYIYNNKIVKTSGFATVKDLAYLNSTCSQFISSLKYVYPQILEWTIDHCVDIVHNFGIYSINSTTKRELLIKLRENASTIFVGASALSFSTIISIFHSLICEYMTKYGDAAYQIIKNYHDGDFDPVYSEKYVSKNTYYDSETHIMLGRYLRYVSNMTNINLMPYYNCFCNKIINNYSLSINSYSNTIDINNNHKEQYVVYAVPVKLGKTYTIAMDSKTNVLMRTCFYDDSGVMTFNAGDLSDPMILSSFNYSKSFGAMSFNHPVYVTIPKTMNKISMRSASYLKQYENNLYLFIQTEKNNTSSIVVLEGEYTNKSSSKYIVGDNDVGAFTYPSLLLFNSHKNFAFSDRLIEYLLQNVISTSDQISNNITTVTEYMKLDDAQKGIWDSRIISKSFKYLHNTYEDVSLPYDISGFIDKTIEKEITKGNNA